jgi:hypothetical protein
VIVVTVDCLWLGVHAIRMVVMLVGITRLRSVLALGRGPGL